MGAGPIRMSRMTVTIAVTIAIAAKHGLRHIRACLPGGAARPACRSGAGMRRPAACHIEFVAVKVMLRFISIVEVKLPVVVVATLLRASLLRLHGVRLALFLQNSGIRTHIRPDKHAFYLEWADFVIHAMIPSTVRAQSITAFGVGSGAEQWAHIGWGRRPQR